MYLSSLRDDPQNMPCQLCALPRLACDDPDRMDDAWNVAQDRQENIEPELSAQADREEHADGRQQNGKQDAQKICHGIAIGDEAMEGTAPWPFRSNSRRSSGNCDAAIHDDRLSRHET